MIYQKESKLELREYSAYLIEGGTIMITLEENKNAIYLRENGDIRVDEWENPHKVITKLNKKNFDVIVKPTI